MNLKVLVTGASGFVGHHLCQKLSEQGHEVYGLARNPQKFEEFKVQAKLVKGDLLQGFEWINELPEDLDIIVHTAGVVHSFDSQFFFDVNTKATKVFTEKCLEKFPGAHYIFLSSLAAAGPNPEEVRDESQDPSPVSDYGRSKLESEEYLKKGWTQGRLTILRPPIVIGPGDPGMLDVFQQVSKGLDVLVGDAKIEKVYSFICVHDLVESIILSFERQGARQEVYFTSYPDQLTLPQLYDLIGKQIKKEKRRTIRLNNQLVNIAAKGLYCVNKFIPVSLKLTPDKVNEICTYHWRCDSKKSEKEMNLTYQWPLVKSVEITCEDYQKRGWL